MNNLINKVGGIERAREIVSGAPDWAKAHNSKMKQYTTGFIRCGSDIFLDDLRIAIAEHDAPEFKVGDLVVLRDSLQEKVLKVQMFHDDFVRAFAIDSSDYSFGHKINFRHATQSEIEAGRRDS